MARTAADYGIPDYSDQVLQTLAGNAKRYGEKSRFAGRELATRQGLLGEADQYKAALQRAAYSDAGAQYGQGLGDISNYLARSGPLADSGAGTALRMRLASQIYGGANQRIGQGYADFLGGSLRNRRNFLYQQALARMQQQQQKTGLGGILGGIGGAIGGPFLGALGAGLGTKLGGRSNYGGGGQF